MEGDLTSRDPFPLLQHEATGTCVLDGTRKTRTESRARDFQAVWWLGLCAFAAKSMGLIPGRGTKILHATCAATKKKKKKKQDRDDLPMLDSGMGRDVGPVMVPSAHTPSLGAPPKALRGQATCRGPHLECVEEGMDTQARRCRSPGPVSGREGVDPRALERLPEVPIWGTWANLSLGARLGCLRNQQ